ncbi:hypothetical protein BegalDRAFT_0981 [Beggiatoa alba B18LD]|uniref:Porin domain-containing protein n=1 Tax=Beggiatoa alba B18LD TaxID=395493 RepID=I3CE42_9GAMM|nr:hypothetical protein [Beggiatoa alba]EIJ41885.1 hypothetical protein BegalDRAFT_0981 [Beggiatoa alba B18LD]
MSFNKHLQVSCASALVALAPFAMADDTADMKRQIQQLQQRLDTLESTPSMSMGAKPKYSLQLSGHVNRAVMYADDGIDSDTFFVDGDTDASRVEILGKHMVSDDVTIGTNIEVEYISNSSSEVYIDQPSSLGGKGFNERTLEFYVESNTLGRLTVGQGSMASDDKAEYDLNDTALAGMYSFGADFGAGLSFRDADTKAYIGTIADVHSNFDGLDKDDRVRYDTPSFGGFTLSLAAGTAAKWDAGIEFQRAFGPVEVVMGLGYGNVGDSEAYLYEDEDGNAYQLYKHVYSGSLSVLHSPSGLSLTIAGGGLSNDSLTDTIKDLPSDISDTLGDSREDTDPFSWSAKLGYAIDATGVGKTSFGISYNRTEDYRTCMGYDAVDNIDVLLSCGDRYTSYGFGFVQAIEKASTEVYFGVRNHELETSGFNPEDILTVYGGARVKF